MKRPEFPNRCSARYEKEHETLMVPPPILHRLPLEVVERDGIIVAPDPPSRVPTEPAAWMMNGYMYPDDEGGEFWIITSICMHCGGAFTITKDV